MQSVSENEIDSLSKVRAGSKHSGFGVILNATRGIQLKSRSAIEYCTQLKLMDSSYHPAPGSDTSHIHGHLALFIFWTQEDNQPFTYKIGDIIRFSNFDFDRYRDQLQGKNKSNATWCIFYGESGSNEPYFQSSDYKEQLTEYHLQQLDELRQWKTSYFHKFSLKELDWYSFERHLENPVTNQNFDLLMKVEDIRLIPDNTSELIVLFTDEKLARYEARMDSKHGKFLKEGDIVKLSSVEKIENKEIVGHKRYFAILGIPNTFKDSQDFMDEEEKGI